MLTLREVAACEGYYLNVETGDILRNVKPQPHQCDNDHWQSAFLEEAPDVARFRMLSDNVTASLEDMLSAAKAYLGRPPSGQIINHQTAAQPNGTLITEVSTIHEHSY